MGVKLSEAQRLDTLFPLGKEGTTCEARIHIVQGPQGYNFDIFQGKSFVGNVS